MAAKRVLITGATSGIGREVAQQLARQGAELILACRDTARGEKTAAEIVRDTRAPKPAVIACDTSSQRSIRACAVEVRAKYDRLDVLINDAGTQCASRRATPDGIEEVFATNVLGYFLLTNELLDRVKAAAPSRIVNVASTYAGEFEMDDLEFTRRPFDNVKSYKQSKQANRMLTWALARKLAGTNVTANAMSPGLVATGLYRDMKGFAKVFMSVFSKLAGRTVAQGADTVTWLATSPEVEGVTGKFWDQRRELDCEFRNERAEARLWEICERYVAKTA